MQRDREVAVSPGRMRSGLSLDLAWVPFSGAPPPELLSHQEDVFQAGGQVARALRP
jgi:hypothetical protein